jgi:hypothetical protein
MNKWFYAKDGQAIGPLSTPEMHELIGQGACTRTTLVWTRGMRDWLPACMAAWMWEQRPERGTVTDEAGPDAAQGEQDAAVAMASAEAPAVPASASSAKPSHREQSPAARPTEDGAQAEGGDAGVVGMVRKLFGLG